MKNRGFTLIEILVAVVILALLAGLVQGIYATVVKNRERVEAETGAVHSAAALCHRIADELAMAFWSEDRPEATALKIVSKAEGLSALEFATRVPAVSGIRTGGDVRLSYELLRDTEAREGNVYILRRVERADLLAETDRDDILYDWPGFRRFRVECYDGERWRDSWDSATEDKTRLPRAVRVEIVWLSGETERTMRVATPLYGAPEPKGPS